LTLALHAYALGHRTTVWVPQKKEYQELSTTRLNSWCLPDHRIPEGIVLSDNLEECCRDMECLILAIPSHAVRSVMERALSAVSHGTVLISAVKGIEVGTLQRMSEILDELFAADHPIMVLSGPSFAVEMARGDPTAIVLACREAAVGQQWQQELSGRNIRLYGNEDMIGTELGGAVKNVIAIAAGVLHGIGYGSNTVAALITRGLSEIRRLVLAAGGQAYTTAGLAGLGDLVLTCTGGPSRNRRVGIALGQGRKLEGVLEEMGQVAEGVITTESTLGLAQRYQVEMPIVRQVHALLYEGVSPDKAIRDLMDRQLKREDWS